MSHMEVVKGQRSVLLGSTEPQILVDKRSLGSNVLAPPKLSMFMKLDGQSDVFRALSRFVCKGARTSKQVSG